MYAVFFHENNNIVLNQALRVIPNVGEAIKIKGRKGTVKDVLQIEATKVNVYVEFEKIIDKKSNSNELGKKKKR